MCGIAGILKFNGQVSNHEIKTMTDRLVHRGPDGEGIWFDKDRKIGLGHRRLAIIDLSDAAAQPMSFADRYTITYNGEIYNFIELKKLLVQNGYTFKTSSDTEILLAMFHWKGVEMLNYLDGMFAFAIWDNESSKLFCARDRFGEKPFYYCITENGFYFASEMKALFAVGISTEVNKLMLTNYLLNDLVIHPTDNSQTFYSKVKKLNKASFIEVALNGVSQQKPYYNIKSNLIEISPENAKNRVFELLNESVKRRLRSDVQVGSSISGGLDSAIIAKLIKDNLYETKSTYDLVTYSARFNEPGFSEDEFLDCILDDLKVKNYGVYPNEKLIYNEIQQIFYHQEEPFLATSILNQWDVMRLAKNNNTTVLLDGQGADELLAGYGWYRKIHLLELAKTNKKSYHDELSGRIANGFSKEKLDFIDWMKINLNVGINAAAKIRHYSKQKWGLSFISKNAVWHNVLNPSYCNIKSLGLPIVPAYPLQLNAVLAVDFSYVLEPILRYADRNAMAHSREVRMPYLSHDFVDFCFSLDPSFKIKHGWKKFILRKAIESKIPDKITWRRDKMGYAAPEKKMVKR